MWGLRERAMATLSQNRVCVVATHGPDGAWAVPVEYQSRGLELDCRLPRWSDSVYHIQQDPRVMAIVIDLLSVPLRWLQCRGLARLTEPSDDRYVTIRIAPEHIDLIDEDRGWGARETLDV